MNHRNNSTQAETEIPVDLAELAAGAVSNTNQTIEQAEPTAQQPEVVRIKPVAPVRPFHNQRDPQYKLFREKPEHRLVCLLKAQGCNHKEIAERTGYTTVYVSYVTSQPWAQELIAEELALAGRSEIEHILSCEAIPSLQKLVTLRDDPEANKEIQRKAANDLLDRIFGKPNQPITHRSVDPQELTNEELAKIAKGGVTN